MSLGVFRITAQVRLVSVSSTLKDPVNLTPYGTRSLPDSSARLKVLPLHAGLSTADQLAIFHPSSAGSRKVVVATNIAEASVTIDGVKWVVDCGFVKVGTSEPKFGLDSQKRDTRRFVHSTRKHLYQRCLPHLSHGLRRSKEPDVQGGHLLAHATASTLRAHLKGSPLLVFLKYKGLCIEVATY
jgi:hypothetical protein